MWFSSAEEALERAGIKYCTLLDSKTLDLNELFQEERIDEDYGTDNGYFVPIDKTSSSPAHSLWVPCLSWDEIFALRRVRQGKTARPVQHTTLRLSKEDWLKQHYPELSELPKWRFPAAAVA
jgi:hypothetical protein